ncbi:MAG: hypothetical protein EOM54_02340 [Clostridia bacterium]|nr:hypothetical protein [Clostridia bacterium]
MRITNSMMASQFLSDANASLNRVSKYQNQVDSTKKITSISDDPQATITMLKARNRLSNLSLYQGNITTANSYLSEAESAADEIDEVLKSVYEQLISAESGAKSDEELSLIADDLRNLMDEVVSIGNNSIGTSYIFGGFNNTGSTDGVDKTAPFSVDEVTGDLIYNGINLSQIAWSEDFSTETARMSDFASSILDLETELGGSLTDFNSLSTATSILNDAADLISCGETACHAAEEFGISSGSSEYTAFSDFLSDLSDLYDELQQECSKEIAGDYILESDPAIQLTSEGGIDYDYYEENGITVMTDDEFANCYSVSDCQTIAGNIAALLEEQYDAGGNPIGSEMEQAAEPLAAAVAIPSAVQDAIAAEAVNRTELQIGSDQTVEISFTGLDILGEGKDNIYHLIGKCVSILDGDLTSGDLSGMISEIQNAQSEVLSFETRIGATQSRLSLISSRYDASEINYTEMKSEAEDVDMAEAITNFTTAQTVYSAALAAGAELIQTSLIDFLR